MNIHGWRCFAIPLALLVLACDGKSPVEPGPVPTPAAASERLVTATFLNAAGAKVPGVKMEGSREGSPALWTVYANDGDGSWYLFDGRWSWTIKAKGYWDLPVVMIVDAQHTQFVYRLGVAK